MPDLRDLIDRFDRLVTIADGMVPDEVLDRAARVGRRARDRRGFLGDTVVVALAGGTGSGKSSLINALAGEIVAEAGAQRPTTYQPLAWIPSNPEPGLVRLLDSIGIDERVGQDTVPWLAIIDLPDTDSVSEENRATVERVLPLVDAVVWVVDPEKYKDRVLHERYLRPLARHSDRFRFVLNQSDRIAPDDIRDMIEDFAVSLRVDGIADPGILAMAADPPMAHPVGIDEFLEAMASLGSAKSVVEAKLVSDLDTAASELTAAAGVVDHSGTGFRETWDSVREAASGDIVRDLIGPATVQEAGRLGARAARVSASLRARPAEFVDVPVAPTPAAGTRHAIDRIDHMLADLIETVGPEHAGAIRGVREGIEQSVAGAAVSVGSSASVRLDAPPAWWGAAGWVRLGASIALGAAAWGISAANDLVAPLPAVSGLLLALVAYLAIGAWVARSGRQWAQAAVAASGDEVAAAIGRELDRRTGRPVRDALRVRAGLAAAHAEFELIRSSLDRR